MSLSSVLRACVGTAEPGWEAKPCQVEVCSDACWLQSSLETLAASLNEWGCGEVRKLWANGGVCVFVQQHEGNCQGVSCTQACT